MILRIVLTLLIFAAWGAVTNIVSPAGMLMLGKQAVTQLNPSDGDYLQTMGVFATYRGINWIIGISAFLLLLAVWMAPIKRAMRPTGRDFAAALAALAVGAMALWPTSARAYYDKQDWAEWRNILPNQSAFLIPAVGDNKSSQAQFGSVDYLETKKVAAKRIQIPHVKLENSGAFSNFYIPAATLIIVDRTPFYREWSDHADKGTSKSKEGFTCESRDSLNVTTAIAISATVSEADAHKFLYWFGVKPVKGDPADPNVVFTSAMDGVSLAEVMDTVVRGKVHASLCGAMATRNLDDLFSQKGDMIKEVEADAKTMFAPMGITIGFLGFADAFDYDESIQRAINHVYTANKDAAAAAFLSPALPVMQAEADIQVKRGIADGIRTKGIPQLPSFVVLPQSWIDAAGSFFNSPTKPAAKQ